MALVLLLPLAITLTAQTRLDLRTQTKSVDFSTASSTKPSKTGTVLPTTCTVGETFLNTGASAGKNLYVCTLINTWSPQGAPDVSGNADKVLSNDGTATGWRALAGDVSGRPDALTVGKIQGRPVSGVSPTAGQPLVWNGLVGLWEPANLAFAQLSGTVTDPQVGAGINAAKIGGGAVSNSTFAYLSSVTSDIQAQLNAKAGTGQAVSGDVSGNLGAMRVVGLQNRTVSSTQPSNGQGLTWNSAAAEWQPQNVAGGTASGGGYSSSFTSQTTVTITGAMHQLGSANLLVGCYDTSVPAMRVQPNTVSVDPTLFDVTITFAAAQSGRCVVVSGGLGSGGGGAYSSSFTSQTTVTITGAMHQLGSANLLVGCYDTSVPAVRVQPNTVSVHPTLFNVTITFAVAQSGRCVISSGGSGSGGSSAPGASMGAQLGDFNVTATTPTVLTVGANCSTATPCNARFGTRVYSFTSSSTVTLAAGTGTAYGYLDSNGTLTTGHNLTLTCTAPCIAAPGVIGFPLDSIPLFTWTATAGAWDAAGGLDKRALLTAKTVIGGVGIATIDTGLGSTRVAVDVAAVPTYLTASMTLNFGSMASGTCAGDLTFPLVGAAVGNSVAPGLPSGLEPGLIANMRVSAANTIAVRLCNLSGGSVSPAGATYTGTILRSF